MITYKNVPNSGMVKTGLAASFSVEQDKINLKVTSGSLEKEGQTYVLPEDVSLELSSKLDIDVKFVVMLAKNVANNELDIVVDQFTSKSRGVPPIMTKGYDLIQTLGKGRIPAGTTEPEYEELVMA